MPHLIIEHSQAGLSTGESYELLESLKPILGEMPTIDPANLKFRAIEATHSYGADPELPHVHITFKLLKGRDDLLKVQIAKKIFDHSTSYIEAKLEGVPGLSVEVVELQTYCKEPSRA